MSHTTETFDLKSGRHAIAVIVPDWLYSRNKAGSVALEIKTASGFRPVHTLRKSNMVTVDLQEGSYRFRADAAAPVHLSATPV